VRISAKPSRVPPPSISFTTLDAKLATKLPPPPPRFGFCPSSLPPPPPE